MAFASIDDTTNRDEFKQRVITVLYGNMEPNEPQNQILKLLEPHNGKLLTKRHTDMLTKECKVYVRVEHTAGMTYLAWRLPHTDYADRNKLLVSYNIKNVKIDIDFIKEYNSCYFEALEQRNAARIALINSPDKLVNLLDEFHKTRDKFLDLHRQVRDFSENCNLTLNHLFDDNFYEIGRALERSRTAKATP